MTKILIFICVLACTGSLMFGLVLRARGEVLPEHGTLKISKGAIEDLQSKMQAYVSRQQVRNLSYGVWQDGILVAEGDIGPVSETNPASVSDTTIYRIRSMTKPVTAIGLLILMERGHFRLSDPITKFLPEFEQTETLADYDPDGTLYTYRSIHPPTMGQLLSHTAGFAYWRPNGGIIDQKLFASGIGLAPDIDTLVDTAAQFPYATMPGAEWHYSIASDLQGAIIERITGDTLAQFLEREIFQPLDMTDTAFHIEAPHMARLSGVTRYESGQAAYTQVEPADLDAQCQVYFEGGHGLFSTRGDYLKFLNMLRQDGRAGDRQLISVDTLRQFKTNAIRFRGAPARQRTFGKWAGLGFGLGIGTLEDPLIAEMAAPKDTLFWDGALGTWFWLDPVNDIVFIGMIQSETQLKPDLMRTAMTAIYGEPVSAISSHRAPVQKTAHASEGSG